MPDQTQHHDPTSQHDQPDTGAEDTQPNPGITGSMDEQPDHGEKSYEGSGRLQDKRTVVTGGDSGIGRAIALAFASEGADVVIAYLADEEGDAQETVRLIEDAGGKAVSVPGDLTDEEQCQHLIDTAVKELRGIDVVQLVADARAAARRWPPTPPFGQMPRTGRARLSTGSAPAFLGPAEV